MVATELLLVVVVLSANKRRQFNLGADYLKCQVDKAAAAVLLGRGRRWLSDDGSITARLIPTMTEPMKG